jgi:hypothetical protein
MWKMTFMAMILLLPAGSCLNGASAPAICDGTAASRTAHAAALAQDGGDLSVVTGARLIRQLDAGCRG